MAHTSEYKTWKAMKRRCLNKNSSGYGYYGARGIGIDASWLEFKRFFFDMGKRPSENYSLERLDVNGNYCKENCVWATRKEQSRNMRSNRIVRLNGLDMVLVDACAILKIKYSKVLMRMNKLGWTFDEAAELTSRSASAKRTSHNRQFYKR
jgi:hypothetical protein